MADDHWDLWSFDAERPEAARRIRCGLDDPPADTAERKRRKPDLEALVRVPLDGGALLALGSGSTERRHSAVLWRDETARFVDLTALHAALGRELHDLNLEGAAVLGEHLVLLQRGNGAHAINALVRLDLAAALHGVGAGAIDPRAVVDVRRVELGHVDGVALALTDAVALRDGRLLFTAAAESGESSYHDGENKGAAVGVLGRDSRVELLAELEEPWKVEGVEVVGRRDRTLELVMVADPDDIHAQAPVLRATLDLP